MQTMRRLIMMTLVGLVTAVVLAPGLFAQDKQPAGQADRERRAESSERQPGAESEAADKQGKTGKPDKVVRTKKQWRELLTPAQFRVLRLKDTEPPFRNKYDKHFEPGTYACAACGQELFESTTKFNSGCGWPAFYAAKAGDRVILVPDYSLGMIRTEVICARCESHLGHVFRDAPQTPTGNRFCINSLALKFIPADAKKKADAKQKESASPVKQPETSPAATGGSDGSSDK